MGKLQTSTLFTDSETEDSSGSMENVKKKKRSSILKCSNGNMKKKKCKFHTKSEPNDSSDCRSRSSSRSRSRSNHRFVYKLHGILKNDNKEKERDYGSTDEDDEDMPRFLQSKDRCLVGRVPRPAGTKPGRGGGLAFIIRKNCSNIPPQDSSTSEMKQHRMKRLARKKSY